jgi:preprotein translocase subunit SecY
MASAAEQLAANLNLGVFSKATELKRRIWFTLGALIVYRIGTKIPHWRRRLGDDRDAAAARRRHPGHVDTFTAARWRMTVFSSTSCHISASIIIQPTRPS